MYRSRTRTWYDHTPRPVRAELYPRVNVARHHSTPEALPIGRPRGVDRRHARGTAPIGIGLGHAGEIYRMRTASHLYDERDVDFALDLERDVARRSGHLLADCHTCEATRHVTPDTERCLQCGTEF